MDYVVSADLVPIRIAGARPAPLDRPATTGTDDSLPGWARGALAIGLAAGAMWVLVKVADAQSKV